MSEMNEMNEMSEPHSAVYPVSVKGVLLTPDGDVVLLLNERDEWELPGGRIELGESSSECLTREIREELDLQVSVGAPIDTYLFEVIPDKHVFIATYRCELTGPVAPVVSHEHKRVGTFSPHSLPLNLPEGYRRSIQMVCGPPLNGWLPKKRL